MTNNIEIKGHDITKENYKQIRDLCKEIEFDTDMIVGIRFEELDRNVGDTCEDSKHNADRVDERDFPEYDSEEYDDLETLDGTSAWSKYKDISGHYYSFQHCYIIGSKETGNHPNPDEGEILLREPTVLVKLF